MCGIKLLKVSTVYSEIFGVYESNLVSKSLFVEVLHICYLFFKCSQKFISTLHLQLLSIIVNFCIKSFQ